MVEQHRQPMVSKIGPVQPAGETTGHNVQSVGSVLRGALRHRVDVPPHARPLATPKRLAPQQRRK
eukprot:5666819-Prorocentrum_lima.AAC.1